MRPDITPLRDDLPRADLLPPPPPLPPINGIKVDCDAHKTLAQEYGVSGFPSLKLFKEGKPSDYTGPRAADDMVKFVKKKSGPAAKVRSSSVRVFLCGCSALYRVVRLLAKMERFVAHYRVRCRR